VPPPPWRKIVLAAAVVLVLAGVAAALLVPEIEKGKDERAAAERRKHAAFEAAKQRRLAREGRPRTGAGTRPPGRLTPAQEWRARRVLVSDLEHAITDDARARVRRGNLDGPILETECRIEPPSQRPLARDLSVPRMEYDCIAITSRDPGGQFVVGHTFDAVVYYKRFRFRWAKACRPPGEGAARLEC
jgi:hypothetical protein